MDRPDGNIGSRLSSAASGGSMSSVNSSNIKSRSTSVPAQKRLQPTLNRHQGVSGVANAGAVDEEFFYQAFEDVPKVQIYSSKDVSTHMEQIRSILSNPNNDWNKRIDMLKRVRSLLIVNAQQYEEIFYQELKVLELPLQLAVKDLRSQLVREASVTIAYLSETLKLRFEHTAEALLPALLNLIQNSAKIMASSGFVTCRFIVKNTQSPRLVPVLCSYLNSKSKDIRRAICELLSLVISMWSKSSLERAGTAILSEGIRLGLSDADVDARAISRRVFWSFQDHFADEAQLLFQSLEPSRQRQLRDSTSSGSIHGSQENILRSTIGGAVPNGSELSRASPGRSTSDIDTGAARRAVQRHVLRTATSRPGTSVSNMPRTTRPPVNSAYIRAQQHINCTPASVVVTDDSRSGRSTLKSISQPGSRSNSPSSRAGRRPLRAAASQIPCVRSRDGSRERSPIVVTNNAYSTTPRAAITNTVRRLSNEASPTNNGRYVASPHSAATGRYVASGGKSGYIYEGDSMLTDVQMHRTDDDSENSSICSDITLSLAEALKNCASTQWSERKEGMTSLQEIFRLQRPLSHSDLKRVVEMLARMFVDPHSKTLSLLLDTLVELLASYRFQLKDWLYLLMTRLLTKLSAPDLLPSMSGKLQRTLGVLRESFSYTDQLNTLFRYIMDPIQTPSPRVKQTFLSYMIQLCKVADASCLQNCSQHRQALQRLAGWATEPRQPIELRRSAQTALFELFSLNSPEFTVMLSTFDKSLQDAIYSMLHTYLQRQSNNCAPLSQVNAINMDRTGQINQPIDLEQVRLSLRQTSAEIQQYNFGKLDGVRIGSQDSGIVDITDGMRSIGLNGTTNANLMLSLPNDDEKQLELVEEYLSELSQADQDSRKRLIALNKLKTLCREHTSASMWDEHFKSIIFLLFEHMFDENQEVRACAVRTLNDVCRAQPQRFDQFTELTITKLLEAQNDSQREVARFAEDCAATVAANLPPKHTLRSILPFIKESDDSAVNNYLAAIKICTRIIERLSTDDVLAILPDLMPGILNAYCSKESSVRKAAIWCLVAIYIKAGTEAVEPYLTNLSVEKRKLVEVYIAKKENLKTTISERSELKLPNST